MHYFAIKPFSIVPSSKFYRLLLARTLLTATNQITAHPVDITPHHLAQVKALQRWLGFVRCALRGNLCGLLFHAVTKTCAPFAKAGYVKATRTLPNASSVADMWSDGLPFTDLKRFILMIHYPIQSSLGDGKPGWRLFTSWWGSFLSFNVTGGTWFWHTWHTWWIRRDNFCTELHRHWLCWTTLPGTNLSSSIFQVLDCLPMFQKSRHILW